MATEHDEEFEANARWRKNVSAGVKRWWKHKRASEAAQRAAATRRRREDARRSAADNERERTSKKPLPSDEQGGNALTSCVKYVPDDEVTARVELLRRLMPQSALLAMLTKACHERFTAHVEAADSVGAHAADHLS